MQNISLDHIILLVLFIMVDVNGCFDVKFVTCYDSNLLFQFI